jgi:putative SOS response-associated peptidase YedK
MCGRFTLALDRAGLQQAFPQFEMPKEVAPRYNIAPTQPVPVVPNNAEKRVDYFQWGLVPSWAKDPQIGNRMINARSETLAEKPSFRAAYKRRRCLILADGFYEWQKVPGRKSKIPTHIRMQSDAPFAFAGLWESWHSADGSHILSCTIITTTPNELLEPIHNRMPVILPPEAYDDWLDPEERQPAELQGLLKPYPASEMRAYPVSTLVNKPQNDSPELIIPAN